MEKEKNKLRQFALKTPRILEKVVAAILVIGVVYAGYHLVISAFDFGSTDTTDYIESLLLHAFSVIIVIEFIRMLVKNSMNTIIEVLIFAIARGLVAGHETPVSLLIRVLAIAVLLASRKFLFKEFDFEEED